MTFWRQLTIDMSKTSSIWDESVKCQKSKKILNGFLSTLEKGNFLRNQNLKPNYTIFKKYFA